jgi:putative ABC transport system ATP-binding protein
VAIMLRTEDVKKAYAEPSGVPLPVLDIPHFEVAAGQQVVIRGPSGGGKTTLLHAIAGISQVDQGRIEIAGIDITRLPESGRDRFRARNIGYVFQTFNLLPGFSALENVLLGMTFTRQPRDRHRALELLDKVGVAHRATHRPAALSVGEQQRVAVARALVNRPKLLLADEPTANIDMHHQQQVIDLIRSSCQSENVTLLLVTHAAEVAAQFDDVRLLEQFNRVTVPVP